VLVDPYNHHGHLDCTCVTSLAGVLEVLAA
jgi:hypothetical protein